MNNLIVRIATEDDYDKVYQLLKEEYTNNPFFRMLDESFLKEKNAGDSKILVVVEKDEIIGTMRGNLLLDSGSLEKFMLKKPTNFLSYPTLFLTRAATAKDSKLAGINALLRYHFIQYSVKNNIESLSGFV